MNPFLLASLPLIGVALGAFLQSRREQRSQKNALKIKAYSDYLQACAQLSNKEVVAKHSEARVLLAESKARIIIYGSAKVIRNIAEFHRHGATTYSSEDLKRFIEIVLAMREDSNTKVSTDDIAQLLFEKSIPIQTSYTTPSARL
jgi:thiaminase